MPVNIRDKFNRSPLWHSAANDQPSMVRMLINSFNADVESRDGGHGDRDLNGATPLYAAAQFGARDAALELLRLGADVDGLRSGDGSAPIVAAVVAGHKRVVEVLVRSGASKFVVEKSG